VKSSAGGRAALAGLGSFRIADHASFFLSDEREKRNIGNRAAQFLLEWNNLGLKGYATGLKRGEVGSIPVPTSNDSPLLAAPNYALNSRSSKLSSDFEIASIPISLRSLQVS
jgi:hypothetical protein